MSAVVTGAGAGIGAATARELARRGHAVAVTDIDLDAARVVASELDGLAVELDVTSAASIEAAVERIGSELGPVEVWVSNAGISTMHPFLEVPEGDFDAAMTVNAKGVFLCGQAAARHMIASGTEGSIVNVASMAGKRGGVPFLSHYVASKFAVVGMTQAMAYELAPHGIRVNAVCPGYVATAMQQRELAWEAELRNMTPEEVRDLYVADTPLGRLETPEDVARAIAFLAGRDAEFVTGEAIAVNGGAFMD